MSSNVAASLGVSVVGLFLLELSAWNCGAVSVIFVVVFIAITAFSQT